jgi:hypothetical protein
MVLDNFKVRKVSPSPRDGDPFCFSERLMT